MIVQESRYTYSSTIILLNQDSYNSEEFWCRQFHWPIEMIRHSWPICYSHQHCCRGPQGRKRSRSTSRKIYAFNASFMAKSTSPIEEGRLALSLSPKLAILVTNSRSDIPDPPLHLNPVQRNRTSSQISSAAFIFHSVSVVLTQHGSWIPWASDQIRTARTKSKSDDSTTIKADWNCCIHGSDNPQCFSSGYWEMNQNLTADADSNETTIEKWPAPDVKINNTATTQLSGK